MKKYFLSFLFLCATSLVAIGQSKIDSLPKLKLFVKNLKGEMVYLRAYLDKGTPVVDSLLIKSDNDTLILKGTEHDEELWYSLLIGRKYSFNPVLSKNHTAELFFDDKEELLNFFEPDHYRNSASSVDFNSILYKPLPWRKKIYTLKQSINQLPENEKIVVNREIDSLKVLVADYYVSMLEKTTSVATVRNALQSLLGLHPMRPPYTEVLEDLAIRFPHSKVVNDQISWFNKYKFTYSSEIVKSVLENNIVAPDFEFKSLDGITRKLSSYKGTYVLLDFWASWCKPCRLEAPYLKASFVKYKGKKFQIIQLSMDKPQDLEKWKQAIKDDQVDDFIHANKYPDDQVYKDYKIGSLPTNYLIGPDGKIIASNLRGEKLDIKLREVFSYVQK